MLRALQEDDHMRARRAAGCDGAGRTGSVECREPHGAGLIMAVGSENECMHGAAAPRVHGWYLVQPACRLPPAALHV